RRAGQRGRDRAAVGGGHGPPLTARGPPRTHPGPPCGLSERAPDHPAASANAAGTPSQPSGWRRTRPTALPGSVVEAEPPELLGVALPVLGHADAQVEVDAGAEQRLDLLAG